MAKSATVEVDSAVPGSMPERFVHMRGHLRLAAGIVLAALIASSARAQDAYPTRPVEVIVPFAAGGGTDLLARLLCDGLSLRLKQTFVAVNRAGANTNLGTLAAVRSRPDGYTLLMASVGLAANPSLYRKLPFDPAHDLTPIALIANTPSILVINPTLPVKTLAELIAYAKAHPGALNYASYGAGSSPHLAAELFQALTGTKIVHVPYAGGAPAALGVVGNSVQMLFPGVATVLGMVQGGSLRAVAVGSEQRLTLLPDVPTFLESGVDMRSGTWYGLLAPATTPEPIVARLAAAAQETLRDPAVHAKLTEQGAEVAALGPSEFAEFLKQETARLSTVIRNANIRLD
jgi:tripartite-type tricarboxylate transporter receptor subunit TctC